MCGRERTTKLIAAGSTVAASVMSGATSRHPLRRCEPGAAREFSGCATSRSDAARQRTQEHHSRIDYEGTTEPSLKPETRHEHQPGRGRHFDRRTLLRGAGAIGAASMALSPTACSSADDDALTFFFAANPEEADARLRVVDAFQREHPDIKVRTMLSGGDALQHVSIYCAGGKCPDVLMAWEFTYSGLAERGVLLDLNTMLAQDTDRSRRSSGRTASPALYETFTYNGGQYAFPEQWSGTFLYYNKKLFAEAGVRPPPGRWNEPWSFAEFLDAAEALTKRDRSGQG